jgi:hypothetical protein
MRLHEGVDFIGARGDKVRASWGGVVELVASDDVRHGPLEGYGNAVVIRTVVPGLGNVWWLYAHLESTLVRVGQVVLTGQPLGRVGNTTNGKFAGMGPHLHQVTASRAWPKPYGRGSFDPVLAYEALGLAFQPRRSGQRARFISSGAPCPAALGSWSEYALGALGVDPVEGEDYEPPPEAYTEDYEVSDLVRVGPLLLGLGLLGAGVLLVGSVVGGTRRG